MDCKKIEHSPVQVPVYLVHLQRKLFGYNEVHCHSRNQRQSPKPKMNCIFENYVSRLENTWAVISQLIENKRITWTQEWGGRGWPVPTAEQSSVYPRNFTNKKSVLKILKNPLMNISIQSPGPSKKISLDLAMNSVFFTQIKKNVIR